MLANTGPQHAAPSLNGPVKEALIREIEVQPPSASSEAFLVTLLGGAIVLVAVYSIGFRVHGWAAAPAQVSDLLPFQQLFRDLPSSEQRTFRALQEGFTEARNLRVRTGAWPQVAALAGDGVPPFAADALDAAKYHWSFLQDGLLVNYLGQPTRGHGAPDFLLLIQEPPPVGAELQVAGVVDEEHELLPDGRLLHVTWWKRNAGTAPSGILVRPEIEGWTQIRIGQQGQQGNSGQQGQQVKP